MRRGPHRHDTDQLRAVLGELEPILRSLEALLHLCHTEVCQQMRASFRCEITNDELFRERR